MTKKLYDPSNPEPHVMHCLYTKPELIKSEWIDPEWFESKQYADLVEYMNKLDEDVDTLELQDRFNVSRPGVMSANDWQYLMTCDIGISRFDWWVSKLKRNFYRKKLIQASKAYSIEPSEDNLNTMMTASQNAVAAGKPISESTISDLASEMQDKMINGVLDSGIKTYFALNNIFGGGLMPGRLLTIGARPGVGKSAFAINLIIEALKQQPELTVDLFSLEMSNAENYNRLVACKTGISAGKFINPQKSLSDAEKVEVEQAGNVLKDYRLQLYDKQVELTQIVKTVRQRAADADKGYLAIVDYLGLIGVRSQADRRLQIEEITRQFKVLTNELGIPIVLLSQLSRGIENRQDKQPVLSDLRESGSIEQDSNAVGFLWNSDRQNEKSDIRTVTLTIAKNREGALGSIDFRFFASKLQFKVAY
ncbi:DNA helicase [Lactobacillus phage iLp1308]|uniref:Replicative DNA helicase n=2 Tax=Colunavirus TaxID=2843368 RepID=A0A0P0IQD4_9CAUD|nr:DnaB-like replicative helicase [Lactobacillus phage CL1]YP_009208875.1 DnaB-like replicative helicase [Lactobacillus phage iLp1308]ALJ97757.1 replicative DNA helicase [Lactobacillus phage CL1]ALJ97931.1 DNA helicase [Lactobacillus phage iLp1308]